MEPTIVPLAPTRFARRPGRVELGSDSLTIRHPRLRGPLQLPLSAITKVTAGPSTEIFRATTIPLAADAGQRRAARYLTFALRSGRRQGQGAPDRGPFELGRGATVPGALVYRATTADGAQVYVWRTGERLRVRVDSAPQLCKGSTWRLWWKTMDRKDIRVAADGRFQDRGRTVSKVAAGGIDIVTSRLDGRVSGDRVIATYVRQDTYNSADGRFVCPRTEPFVARRAH